MQVKKQQLEPDKEQWTGSKLGKEYVKAVYCHPVYLTYMQSTSCEMLGWIKLKLESSFMEEIPITSDMQMRPPLWQKAWENMGEEDDRGWDGWMASPTQWTRVWASSRSCWLSGKPDMLQSMGHKESDTTEWLNWNESLSREWWWQRCALGRN